MGDNLNENLAALGVAPEEVYRWVGEAGELRASYVTSVNDVTQVYLVGAHSFVLWERTADQTVTQSLVIPASRLRQVLCVSGSDPLCRVTIEVEAGPVRGRVEGESESRQQLGAFAEDGAQAGQGQGRMVASVNLEQPRYVLDASEEAKAAELVRFATAAASILR